MSTLEALHPNHAMLDDLDRRVAGLTAQRAQLLADVPGALPPSSVTAEIPARAAMGAPPAATAPGSPTSSVDAQTLVALYNTLKRQAMRDLARSERTLRTEAGATLAQARQRLRTAADADNDAASREEGPAIQAAGLKLDAAEKRLATARAQLYSMQVNAVGAAAQAKVERQYAIDHPHDERAEARAVKAENWAASSEHRRALLQEDARVEQALVDSWTRELAVARQHLAARQAGIEAQLQRDNDALATTTEQGIQAKLATLRAAAEHDINQQVAKEEERLAGTRAQEPPVTPPVTVDFPAQPAGELRLNTTSLRDTAQRSEAKAGRANASAVQAIDQTIASLRGKRDHIAAQIREETKTIAMALAARHGILLTTDTSHGTEITGQVRQWLAEYWPG